MLVLGVVFMAIAVGAGIPLLGHIFNPDRPLTDPGNGQMKTKTQEAGLLLLVYCGTFSFLLFANLIPTLVVLDFSLVGLRISALVFSLLSITGIALCLAYLVEPHHTFTDSLVVGHSDPLLSALGAFYIFGFFYLLALSFTLFARTVPGLATLRRRFGQATSNNKGYLFLGLMLTLG
jgi:hypothetical protein